MTNASDRKLIHELVRRAKNGDHEGVAIILGRRAHPRLSDSEPLCWAAAEGHVECVKLLIPVSDPKARDSLALSMAADQGHVECVKLLMPVSDPTAENSIALRSAAQNGHAECVAALLTASDANDLDLQALHAAVKNGHVDCVKLLIPASIPNDRRLVSAVFSGGSAEVLSLILAREPLFLAGLHLPGLLADAISGDNFGLSALLAAIIEQKALGADLSSPKERSAAP